MSWVIVHSGLIPEHIDNFSYLPWNQYHGINILDSNPGLDSKFEDRCNKLRHSDKIVEGFVR